MMNRRGRCSVLMHELYFHDFIQHALCMKEFDIQGMT